MNDLAAGRDVAAAEDGGAADGARLGGDGLAGRRIHPRRVRQAAQRGAVWSHLGNDSLHSRYLLQLVEEASPRRSAGPCSSDQRQLELRRHKRQRHPATSTTQHPSDLTELMHGHQRDRKRSISEESRCMAISGRLVRGVRTCPLCRRSPRRRCCRSTRPCRCSTTRRARSPPARAAHLAPEPHTQTLANSGLPSSDPIHKK